MPRCALFQKSCVPDLETFRLKNAPAPRPRGPPRARGAPAPPAPPAPPAWEDQWVCVSDAESELYESESRGLAELVPLVGRLDAAVPAAAVSAGSS